MFTEGFEKEAGLKHVALAGMMALGGHKAHAKGEFEALKAAGNAARQTQVGQAVTSRTNQYLKKAQNISLWGKSGEAARASGAAGNAAGSAATRSPNLSLKDGKRLTLDYGRFSGSAEPGKLKGELSLGKGIGINASAEGGERKAGIMFKREF